MKIKMYKCRIWRGGSTEKAAEWQEENLLDGSEATRQKTVLQI